MSFLQLQVLQRQVKSSKQRGSALHCSPIAFVVDAVVDAGKITIVVFTIRDIKSCVVRAQRTEKTAAEVFMITFPIRFRFEEE